jgi:integrase
MAASFLLLDKRRELQDGTYPVKIAAGFGTNIYISTGVSVRLWEWDADASKVVDRKDSRKLNEALGVRLLRIQSRMLTLREDGRLRTASSTRLRQLLTAPDMNEVPDVEEKPDLGEIFRQCIGTKDRESTRRLYQYTLDKVLAYTGGRATHIEDIDRLWLHGFETFMGGRVNARAVHLRNLRHVCNFALDEGYTTYYPFRKYPIRTEETRHRDLTGEQVRAYARAEVSYRNDAMHRDVFMLMIYLCGINVSDLADLTWEDVRNGRVEYRRNKTGRLYSIKLEPEALEIIERWRGEPHLLSVFDRYRTPHDYNRRLWDALKRIKGPDGEPIEPECTSGWARHTWATIAAELDIPGDTITYGMGHKTGHRTTAIYIHRNLQKLDEANRKVIDYITRP